MAATHLIVRTGRQVGAAFLLLLCAVAQGGEGGPAPGVVSRQIPDATEWLVRKPVAEKVVYRGVVSFDNAAIDGVGMLYPAPNLIGLFAAVLTHGVLSSSAQNSKMAKLREEADKVLLPYQPVLEPITHQALLTQGLANAKRGAGKRIVESAEPAGAAWVIEAAPIFSMTQDERALVLDNAVIVRSPEAPAAVFYQNVVRVVSQPRPASDDKTMLLNFWSAEEGRMLRQESAGLFAESMDIVFAELSKGPDASAAEQRTVRYAEGGGEKVERATPVLERCDRVVLKTLRGWLMSVPRSAAAREACETELAAVAPAAASAPAH